MIIGDDSLADEFKVEGLVSIAIARILRGEVENRLVIFWKFCAG